MGPAMGCPDNRPPSPNSPRDFAGLGCKVENHRPSREKHDRFEEESTATQPNSPSKETSYPGDLIPNTWGSYWIPE
ncbi:hypothetical protein Trydic_g11030 [Trypoxylus dichotomus]